MMFDDYYKIEFYKKHKTLCDDFEKLYHCDKWRKKWELECKPTCKGFCNIEWDCNWKNNIVALDNNSLYPSVMVNPNYIFPKFEDLREVPKSEYEQIVTNLYKMEYFNKKIFFFEVDIEIPNNVFFQVISVNVKQNIKDFIKT